MRQPFLFTTLLLPSLLFSSYLGKIIDEKTKKPIAEAFISDSNHSVLSNDKGEFYIKSLEQMYNIKAYGYKPFSFDSKKKTNQTFLLQPIHVKALYLNFWGASNNSPKLKNILNILKETNLNAIVVDVKNEQGYTSFLTSYAPANRYGAAKKRTNRDIKKFIATMKKNGIYTIARIATFKDDLQATHNPDYALKDLNNTIWRSDANIAWVDPFDKRSHIYTIAIAQEAAKVGFDEINFDYVRFPAKKDLLYEKENNQTTRIETISNFLSLAKKKLRKYGVFISVDTYGTVCWVKDDSNIGHTIPSLAKYADYIAPMLYPSGFSSGSFKFKYPAERPYSVVHRSVTKIKEDIASVRIRPWLQHFRDYSQRRKQYKKKEIQDQIRATKHTKTGGWMFWSPSSKYFINYFTK